MCRTTGRKFTVRFLVNNIFCDGTYVTNTDKLRPFCTFRE
jgi:hypothetical protein